MENFSDGGSCVATWDNGRRNGKAKWIFPDGTIYDGTIIYVTRTTVNDSLFLHHGELFKGNGTLTDANGEVLFKGSWKNTAEVTKRDGSTEIPFVWPMGGVSGNGILFFK